MRMKHRHQEFVSSFDVISRINLIIKNFINTLVPKKSKFEPKDWQNVLHNIKDMRKEHVAPVDTMGCEKCADTDADEPTKRFQILVALMLSSQTKDGK